jgi:hypothetical protein
MRHRGGFRRHGTWPPQHSAVSPTTLPPHPLWRSTTSKAHGYTTSTTSGAFQFLVSTFADLLTDERANETAAQYIRDRIAERVTDPDTAELLTP